MMTNPVYVHADNMITSLGFTTREIIGNIESNRIGFRMVSDRNLTPSPVPLSLIDTATLDEKFGQILANRHPEQSAALFTRLEKMFIVSIQETVQPTEIDITGSRTLLIISTTKGNIDLLDTGKYDFPDPDRIFLWKMADFIGSFFGFVNRPMVISNACISGVLALSMAARMIEAGLYDNILVSGGDILSEFVISGFLSFQALSPEPCKPFDIAHNGLSLGEGCGTLLLSSQKPASTIISVAGSATSNDANHISGPSRTGEELAMAIGKALKEAHLGAAETSFVSAHGTGTVYNDEMESKALGLAGLQDVPVNSFKGYWGHTLGAAGMLESITTLHSMRENRVFRSAGYEEPGLPVPLNILKDHQSIPVINTVKIASGFGGCNAAVVFKKM
jgi:3-oxoacyl-[acyl-carrier-protein] synthase-1